MNAIDWVRQNCKFAGYPTKQESRTYYLARLLQQKFPQQQVEAIAQYLKTLNPQQLQTVLINNGISGNETLTDPNFGLPYPVPAKPQLSTGTPE